MSFNPDPQNITGPTQSPPVQQNDYRVPAGNTVVTPCAWDVLGLSQPLQKYQQPGINFPSGSFPF